MIGVMRGRDSNPAFECKVMIDGTMTGVNAFPARAGVNLQIGCPGAFGLGRRGKLLAELTPDS
jgi:hypothetical protein